MGGEAGLGRILWLLSTHFQPTNQTEVPGAGDTWRPLVRGSPPWSLSVPRRPLLPRHLPGCWEGHTPSPYWPGAVTAQNAEAAPSPVAGFSPLPETRPQPGGQDMANGIFLRLAAPGPSVLADAPAAHLPVDRFPNVSSPTLNALQTTFKIGFQQTADLANWSSWHMDW